MGEKIVPNCYIFGGYIPEFREELVREITENDFVICADKGIECAVSRGVKPDLIIGDFDSYKGNFPNDTEIITLPVEKDDTDLHFAAKEGVKRGFTSFVLSGVTGGRIDMTYASINTLLYLFKRSESAVIMDKSVSIYITDSSVTVKKPEKDSHLSVFPLDGEAKGVRISGATYNADNLDLMTDFPIGVSNSFKDDYALISVKEGKILVMVTLKD